MGPDLRHRMLSQLMDEYHAPLLRYACRLAGPAHAADVVQEAYVRLLATRNPPANGSTKAWLFAVCRNLAMDLHRKETPMTQLTADHDAPAPGNQPAQAAQQAEEVSILMQHVARLGAREQEVLRLKFQDAFSYKEIADITGLSISHVGVLIHTAIKTLRERMK